MKRNLRYWTLVAIAGLAAATQLTGGAVQAQDAPAAGLGGTWKLVVLAYGDDEFAVVKLDTKGGKISGSAASTQERLFGPSTGVKLDPLKSEGETLTMGLTGPAGVNLFHGKLVKDGPNAGKILGNFTFRGEVYPARLEPTKSETVAEIKQGSLIQSFVQVMQDRDPKSKVRKAREAIDKNAGNPTAYLFYGELLGAAEAGGLTATEVAAIVDRWASEAEPYGAEWLNAVRLKALKALSNSKPYAAQTLKLARKAEQLLAADASIEAKAGIAGMIARSAAIAGDSALAAEAQARSAKLEAQLDEEYHKKVPPFTPVKYAGRKNAKADRVVLMELFTGAQCPPCVAADVGFDALFRRTAAAGDWSAIPPAHSGAGPADECRFPGPARLLRR